MLKKILFLGIFACFFEIFTMEYYENPGFRYQYCDACKQRILSLKEKVDNADEAFREIYNFESTLADVEYHRSNNKYKKIQLENLVREFIDKKEEHYYGYRLNQIHHKSNLTQKYIDSLNKCLKIKPLLKPINLCLNLLAGIFSVIILFKFINKLNFSKSEFLKKVFANNILIKVIEFSSYKVFFMHLFLFKLFNGYLKNLSIEIDKIKQEDIEYLKRIKIKYLFKEIERAIKKS